MKKLSKRNIFRIVWFSFVTVFLIWNWTTFQSRHLPKGTFASNDEVRVSKDKDQMLFQALGAAKQTEVIFFQGGLADPKAYAPLCRSLAENGFTCHLIKMRWRLPQNDYQKISKMFDLSSGKYVLGGHSQGAKMAAQFVYENPGILKGLFLMGTSHPRDFDLSDRTIPTIKFYAENDGLASVEEVMANAGKLPKDTKMLLIEGGNHSQFGYLGHLLTDGKATISRETQQQKVITPLLDYLNALEKGM